MKKILSLFLIVSLLLSMNVFASVNEGIKEIKTPEEIKENALIEKKLESFEEIGNHFQKVYTVEKNEYEAIKELQFKSDVELILLGLDKEKIKELRALNYKEKLKERSKYDEKVLKAMGYTDDRIKKLRNYDGSDIQTYAVGATLTMSGYTGSYNYYASTNQTKHQAIATWEWNNAPVFQYTDIIGFAWFEGWHLSSESYNKVYYIHSLGTRPEQYTVNSFSATETIAAQSRFPFQGTVYYDMDYMLARRGLVNAKIYTAGNCLNSNIMIKYGHRDVVGTPSVSIVSGIDFNFNFGTNTEASVLIQYPPEY